MKALAQAQFSMANKKFNAVKVRARAREDLRTVYHVKPGSAAVESCGRACLLACSHS